MKKRVAIFPAGTEIGLEIHNALKYSTIFRSVGFTSLTDHSEFVYEEIYHGIPFYHDKDFLKILNEKLMEANIDFIYPAHDSVLLFLSEHANEVCAKIIATDYFTVDICRSKEKTYEYFKNEKFIPQVFSDMNAIEEYPVFIKPDIGQGSVGAMLISSKDALIQELSKEQKVVICEYLNGDEFTIDCFTDLNGDLRICKMRTRARIKTGISVHSEIVETDDAVLKMADVINGKLRFKGAWFFQVKKNRENEFRLLEIAARIPGTVGVTRNKGINLALMTMFTFMNVNVDINENNYSIEVDRAFINRYRINHEYETVYLDLDDTLILNGNSVNTCLIMFLYQSVNRKKKIILITKHIKKIEDTLKEYKISENLFDEIIHLSPEDNKAEYIKGDKSIFIDDSFSERNSVFYRLGIPVFDLDSIEALIDWRL